MAETPDQPKPSKWSMISSWFPRWPTFVGFALFAAVLLFLVRPFDTPRERPEDNTALAWNAAIERLGMQPLYPPQEDFFVGDVYISLTDPETEIAGERVRFPANVFRGRGVRVARIDLKSNILKAAGAYRFANAKESDGQAALTQASPASASPSDSADIIDLSLVSFPGLSIKHHTKAEAGFWQFSADRRMGETEEISIKSTETYGAPTVDAMAYLQNFCLDEKTGAICTDEAARRLLGYTFGSDVSAVYNNEYIFPIKISIVSQVFLTRELSVSRYRGESLGLDGDKEEDASDGASPEGQPKVPDHIAGTGIEGTASYKNAISNRLELKERFQRPLAFGFRSVSFALARSAPPTTGGGQKK